MSLLRVVVALVTLLWCTGAEAAGTARLVFLRGHGTESCPDEASLREAVAARIGSLGLTISLAIDPMSGLRNGPPEGAPPSERTVAPTESSAPVPPPEPAVDAAPAPSEEPPAPAARPTRFHVGGGVLGSVAIAPSPLVGAVLFVDGQRGAISLGVEGRIDLPSSSSSARSFFAGGSLLGCGHMASFFACVRATSRTSRMTPSSRSTRTSSASTRPVPRDPGSSPSRFASPPTTGGSRATRRGSAPMSTRCRARIVPRRTPSPTAKPR